MAGILTPFHFFDDVIDHVTLMQNLFEPILESESPCSKVYKTANIIGYVRNQFFATRALTIRKYYANSDDVSTTELRMAFVQVQY